MSNWSSQPDEAIRRAAAGVCGWWFDPNALNWGGAGDWRACGHADVADPVDQGPECEPQATAESWLANWNRDDLARVFAAAGETPAKDSDEIAAWNRAWLEAMDDPRAALTQLLDLLQVEVPAHE